MTVGTDIRHAITCSAMGALVSPFASLTNHGICQGARPINLGSNAIGRRSFTLLHPRKLNTPVKQRVGALFCLTRQRVTFPIERSSNSSLELERFEVDIPAPRNVALHAKRKSSMQ